MSETSDDFARLAAEYEELLPRLKKFERLFRDRLRSLVGQQGVSLAFPIESRVKEWRSLRNKLARYSSVTEVQDLLGLRVVTLFKRDVELISDTLRTSREFCVLRVYDATDRLDVDRFGYGAIHLTVELPRDTDDERLLKAEIQVRSAAQHLWAAASHILQYKQEEDVPPPVRRTINLVAGQLEIVDMLLERVLAERHQYVGTLGGREYEPLNVDLLKATLSTIWPEDQKIDDEPYAILLNSLMKRGIRTPRQLNEAVRPYREKVLAEARARAEQLAFLADRYGVEDGKISYSPSPTRHVSHSVTEEVLARARRGAFFSHTGLTFTALNVAEGQPAGPEDLDW